MEGFGSIFPIKKYTHTKDIMVSNVIKIKGARQPNEFPNIKPIGTPNTSEALTPIKTTPIARARNFSVTMFEAIVTHNTTSNEPLAADIIRAINNNTVGLTEHSEHIPQQKYE